MVRWCGAAAGAGGEFGFKLIEGDAFRGFCFRFAWIARPDPGIFAGIFAPIGGDVSGLSLLWVQRFGDGATMNAERTMAGNP